MPNTHPLPRPDLKQRSELPDTVYGVFAATLFGLVIFVLVAPFVVLGPTLAIRRFFGRNGARLAFALIGVPLNIRGRENLLKSPCVAVANHASYIDGVVLTAALPSHFTFVVQDGAAAWPYVGFVIRRMGVSFINRSSAREGAAQTRNLIRRVAEDGESLAIFAEGTFKPEPGLLAFKKGAFLIASRAAVPVLPVGLRGTRRFFGGERRLPRWSRIEVDILPAVPPSGDAQELLATARREVATVCGEIDTLAQ